MKGPWTLAGAALAGQGRGTAVAGKGQPTVTVTDGSHGTGHLLQYRLKYRNADLSPRWDQLKGPSVLFKAHLSLIERFNIILN